MIKIILYIFLILPNITYAEDLRKIIELSKSALEAQSYRLKIISENIANADSTGLTPGSEPYRRKMVVFKNRYNNDKKIKLLNVSDVIYDPSQFKKKFEPNHPAADKKGYVLYPNVSSLIESADAKEAQHSYEANLRSVEITRSMLKDTLDLLK